MAKQPQQAMVLHGVFCWECFASFFYHLSMRSLGEETISLFTEV